MGLGTDTAGEGSMAKLSPGTSKKSLEPVGSKAKLEPDLNASKKSLVAD